MTVKTIVAGVGMIPFSKPGRSEPYTSMGREAAKIALKDAGVDYDKIQEAFVGYVYGDSTAGQTVLYQVGLTGIPVVNVNNNCSTGSTALYLARRAIETGMADCVLALGFEQMEPGALGVMFPDRPTPFDSFTNRMKEIQGWDDKAPFAAQFFGGAGLKHQELYGTKDETFARISVKARRHAANNPLAIFRDPITLEDVMASKPIFGPLTRLQCCPPTCGAAAAVLCSEEFAKKHGLDTTVYIAAQSMTTDTSSSFDASDMRKLVGYDMAKAAADQVYEKAAISPKDIPVVELHDCFSANELISYEALGLCEEGSAEKFIMDNQNTYGGQCVVNPSGGLLSKGHPLGATGLAQCTELVNQLRDNADKRQVEGARFALQHNLGLGGACVVTLYAKQ
ncbi:MAG: lipid-transfer protein [Alphaproteobacteria bacterium]|nr:MAG: lipid-transfer protein [Alphaproteobacteria bacterium]